VTKPAGSHRRWLHRGRTQNLSRPEIFLRWWNFESSAPSSMYDTLGVVAGRADQPEKRAPFGFFKSLREKGM
jgi:hypothetical protein